jgi:hypothetical protein
VTLRLPEVPRFTIAQAHKNRRTALAFAPRLRTAPWLQLRKVHARSGFTRFYSFLISRSRMGSGMHQVSLFASITLRLALFEINKRGRKSVFII